MINTKRVLSFLLVSTSLSALAGCADDFAYQYSPPPPVVVKRPASGTSYGPPTSTPVPVYPSNNSGTHYGPPSPDASITPNSSTHYGPPAPDVSVTPTEPEGSNTHYGV